MKNTSNVDRKHPPKSCYFVVATQPVQSLKFTRLIRHINPQLHCKLLCVIAEECDLQKMAYGKCCMGSQ